jgi:hypothetical protein
VSSLRPLHWRGGLFEVGLRIYQRSWHGGRLRPGRQPVRRPSLEQRAELLPSGPWPWPSAKRLLARRARCWCWWSRVLWDVCCG